MFDRQCVQFNNNNNNGICVGATRDTIIAYFNGDLHKICYRNVAKL